MRISASLLAVSVAISILLAPAQAVEPVFTRQFDLIYHKQDGYALTMERVAPVKNPNGAAVIIVISGGWFSNHGATAPHDKNKLPRFLKQNAVELLRRGYTLFYVVHGTQPKFTIREIHPQISAAVRHIRFHAKRYKISGKLIGITGASAGGHLSLMQGTKGQATNEDRQGIRGVSSKVQAVVSYFPPTDFLNYGKKGKGFDEGIREVLQGRNPFLQALDYLKLDRTQVRLNKITDKKQLVPHYKNISPAYHVTKDDAPTLILHGTSDKLVPIQQAELIMAKLKTQGVPHKLYVKKGGNHGWASIPAEVQMIADWFDRHLLNKNTKSK